MKPKPNSTNIKFQYQYMRQRSIEKKPIIPLNTITPPSQILPRQDSLHRVSSTRRKKSGTFTSKNEQERKVSLIQFYQLSLL